MINLLFSQGGRFDSGGMRGGQISNKLTGSYEKLILNNDNINIKNKIVIIHKSHSQNILLLHHLKNNNNTLIFDVVDWLGEEGVKKYNPNNNKDCPNFFPDLFYSYFDGYIVNNTKMKKWWYENMDKNKSKPIFIIPHHWDSTFYNLPKKHYSSTPYFYFLGYKGHENQNCLYIDELYSKGLISEIRDNKTWFSDKPENGCQFNIRAFESWEYCFKPATKISCAASMDSVIITTNDWSVQDILPKEYPYLLLEDNLESVENMIEKVKLTYNKSEWILAKEILKEVFNKTNLDNIIKEYLKINENF